MERVTIRPITKDRYTIHLDTMPTRNILIPYRLKGKLLYETNVHETKCKFVGYAKIADNKRLKILYIRFESNLLPWSTISSEQWSTFDKRCAKYCKQHPEKFVDIENPNCNKILIKL